MNRTATVENMMQGHMRNEGLTPAERKARALMRARIFNLHPVYFEMALQYSFEEL